MGRQFVTYVMAGVVGLSIGGGAVLAQMHGGHGGQGHDHAGMQSQMQGSMMATDQMMRNIDSMMNNVSSMMRDLNTMHARMPNASQHDHMMGPLQGTFDQMRQLHGSLNQMMRDPTFGHDADSMKGFRDACRNLEQMTSALQSMTKNLTKAMKDMNREPRK